VPKTTYYRHREEFYDPVTHIWRLSKDQDKDSSCEMMIVSSYNDNEVEQTDGNETNKPAYRDSDSDLEVKNNGTVSCTLENGIACLITRML